jgi:protocatechuate 3,4-dioxygenase beta subunit
MEGTRLSRRAAVAMLGAAGAALAAACGGESPTSPSTTTATSTASTTTATTASACAVTPTEVVGPYPSVTHFFRSDVREGRSGTPVALTITVVNANAGCSPVAGVNVEIWQCDAAGNYSEYGTQTAQTYLRGTQTTDASGQVTFITVYPGWYQGRATHIHVDVTRNGSSIKVTQIAFPEAMNNAVYATGVYAARGSNPTSNVADGIFADSINSELATVAGDPAAGLTAVFVVGVAV